MRVIQGALEFPEAALAIDRRKLLRRAATGAVAAFEGRRRVALERLGEVDSAAALAFRPHVRASVEFSATSVRLDPFEIEVDVFERALVSLADGSRRLDELIADASALIGGAVPGGSVDRAVQLFATLGRYEMIAAG